MGFMPRMNISLTNKEMEKLKSISEREHRAYSDQVVHMMEFYIKYKDKKN